MEYADEGVTEAKPAMRFAYREFVTPPMLMLALGITMSMIVLYTFVGPFDTRNTLNWNGRLAYCVVIGVLGLLICYPAIVLTLFLARFQSNVRMMLALAVYSMVMAVPCGAIAYGVYGLFHGTPRPLAELPATYLICAVNILASTALVYWVLQLRMSGNQLPAGSESSWRRDTALGAPAPSPGRGAGATAQPAAPSVPVVTEHPPRHVPHEGGTHETLSKTASATEPEVPTGPAVPTEPAGPAEPTEPAEPPPAGFLDRLPAHLGRDVVYLKVSGHYLEVVTTHGSGVILQRLMDAVRELGSRGMQIHRSYWVAHNHVRYVVRRDRRTLLHLTGDHEVPVSRTFLPEVRQRIKPQTARQRRGPGHPEQQASS
ncbi:MAG: LytTR family DNA-binding domain-containing protein [Spirochaetaceae bacterium]|nr:LytTR family DNA-binding domain-containing protein [Spirochaetaceae bacterium]